MKNKKHKKDKHKNKADKKDKQKHMDMDPEVEIVEHRARASTMKASADSAERNECTTKDATWNCGDLKQAESPI